MKKYNPSAIEKKWHKKWGKESIYRKYDREKKFYALDMFPYPSGAGLHVGHPKGYIATDVLSRLKQLQGYGVLHPMGWDAFGLPAEQYALKNKVHPEKAVKENVATFKKQLEKIGFTYDWEREINTTDPEYYKWTQWIFLQLYKKGLAYQSFEPINWCPSCQTGLANEDLESGRCERCGSVVEKKPMRQWVLRMTEYADRLLTDLDDKKLDWPESIKEQQRNWIGRSEGAVVNFLVPRVSEVLLASDNEGKRERLEKFLKARGLDIKVHTPRSLGLTGKVIKEEGSLKDNTLEKAMAYREVTDLPIIATDAGFFIDGEDTDPTRPKRNALGGKDEKNLSQKEIAEHMVAYYQGIARKNGGKVHAYWLDEWALLLPDKSFYQSHARRHVILTDEIHGTIDEFLPVRSLYISETTGKPVNLQSEEEQLEEMQPLIDAVTELLAYKIPVFTTRLDTIYGCTYVVVAPEHELLQSASWQAKIKNQKEVQAYLEKVKKKTELERTDLAKEKTGVKLEGLSAINPFNHEAVPIFVADYVLGSYGTGAIMAVPAHDERDNEFAKKFHLPIRQVVKEEFDYENVVQEKIQVFAKELASLAKEESFQMVFIGGVAKSFLRDAKFGFHSDVDIFIDQKGWDFLEKHLLNKGFKKASRNGHAEHHSWDNHQWFWNDEVWLDVFLLEEENGHYFDRVANKKHEWGGTEALERVVIDDVEFTVPRKKLLETIYQNLAHTWNKVFTGGGILANSGPYTGMRSEMAKKSLLGWLEKNGLGESKINYKMRDWVFSRQRYWGEPIPIIHCTNCGVVPVPEEDLPVKLPHVKSYEPTGTGESPLANIESWVNVECPACSGPAKRETNTMPQWAGSSWYYLRYIDPKNDQALVNKEKERSMMPVDVYVGGAEHATRHLLYARFWHKFLFDLSVVSTEEPFHRLFHVGLILAPDGRKMSKRWGNVINPDDMVAEFGADAFRLYEMFMGPFGQAIAWNTDGVVGMRRFLEKVWKFQDKVTKNSSEGALEVLLHKTIKKVTEDIQDFKFNTAVSSLMILANEIEKASEVTLPSYQAFLLLLSPFAPHMAEELWELSGETKSIFLASWPVYDQEKLKEEEREIVVQINGKVRDRFVGRLDSAEEDLRKTALGLPKIAALIDGQEVRKVIVVAGKVVNIVV